MMAEIQGGRFERKVAGSVGSNLIEFDRSTGNGWAEWGEAPDPFGIGSRGDGSCETMTLCFTRPLSEGLRGWFEKRRVQQILIVV